MTITHYDRSDYFTKEYVRTHAIQTRFWFNNVFLKLLGTKYLKGEGELWQRRGNEKMLFKAELFCMSLKGTKVTEKSRIEFSFIKCECTTTLPQS